MATTHDRDVHDFVFKGRQAARHLGACFAILALLWPGGSPHAAMGQAGGDVLMVDAVDPNAKDEGPGTAAAPFRTISQAVAAARPGTTVLVKAGVYREQVNLTVSGEAGKPITIMAAPGQRAIISGSDVIRRWKRCASKEIPSHTDTRNIWYVDLPASLEITGSLGSGVRLRGGSHNHAIRCTAYYCRSRKGFEAAAGFEFQGEAESSIRNCLSVLNGYGVMQSGCQRTRVEENAIGRNMVDGMNLSWHSRDVLVRGNYIFDAWDKGHPDGLQTYRW